MAKQRRGPARPANGQSTAQAVLKAAEKCFDRYGLHRTTMDDIAAVAGVSRMTLYRYFKDRDALISAIVSSRATKFITKVRAVLAQQPTFEAKLIEGLLFLAEAGRKDHFVGMLLRSESSDFTNKVVFDRDGTGVAFAAAVWDPVFDEAIQAGELTGDIDRTALHIWLTSVNFMMIAWLDDPDADPDYYRAMVRRFVVPGLLPNVPTQANRPKSARKASSATAI